MREKRPRENSPEPSKRTERLRSTALPENGPVGEPLRRPDGIVIGCRKVEGSVHMSFINTDCGSGIVSVYSDQEVTHLGNGSWWSGALRLGQHYYEMDSDGYHSGSARPLDEFLEEDSPET